MGSGVHFSLDQLPERYRAQVARSALVGGYHQSVRPHGDGRTADNGACAGKDGQGHGKDKGKTRAPVRLPRSAGRVPNKTEERFNREMLLGCGKYEGLTLHLPSGVRYTPDFVFEDDGKVYLAEVKGGYHLPTHGRSVMAFKIACAEFPMFGFVFAELCRDGRTWKVGVYEGGLLKHTAEGTALQLHGGGGD